MKKFYYIDVRNSFLKTHITYVTILNKRKQSFGNFVCPKTVVNVHNNSWYSGIIRVRNSGIIRVILTNMQKPRCLCTGCSLDIVFFLKMLWFFWTLQVLLLQRWCLTCHCVLSLTRRGNRERPESEIYLKIFEITQYLKKTPCMLNASLSLYWNFGIFLH